MSLTPVKVYDIAKDTVRDIEQRDLIEFEEFNKYYMYITFISRFLFLVGVPYKSKMPKLKRMYDILSEK